MASVLSEDKLTTIQAAYQYNLAVAQDRLHFGGRVEAFTPTFFETTKDVLPLLRHKELVKPSLDFDFYKFQEDIFGIPASVGGRAVYINPTIPSSYKGDDRYARYEVDQLSGSDGLKNFITRFSDPSNYLIQAPQGQKSSIWDSVFKPFGGSTSIVDFLNPITGVKALTKISNSSESTNFGTNIVKPQQVNYFDELLKGTTNVVGSVGIALGVEGVSQGVGGYISSTTPLPVGTQGPISPGFWSTLSSGNIQGAWDIVTAPFSSIYHSPSTDNTLTSTSKATAIGQIVNEFVQLTGNVGKGIIQFVSGDFTGAVRTITGETPTQVGPTPLTPNLFGNFQGGGGGSGLGVSANAGQLQTNPIVFPLMGIVIFLIAWLVVRKK